MVPVYKGDYTETMTAAIAAFRAGQPPHIVRVFEVAEEQPRWNLALATTLLAMVPPVVVVLLMQRWFVKGFIETEK